MAKNDPAGNADRYSARGAVLLCAPPLFRRSTQKSQFWNIRLQVCHPSVAHWRKFIRGVSASERIAEVMRHCQGKMMVSINDHPEMRRVFADFPTRTLQTTYTLNGRSKS